MPGSGLLPSARTDGQTVGRKAVRTVAKKKRMTQREKAENAAFKKKTQKMGVRPPDKPRLNRKKFAKDVWAEYKQLDVVDAAFHLHKAVGCMVASEMHEITSEQVGVLKLIKIAVDTHKYMKELEAKGESQYSLGEYVDKVVVPIMRL